MSDRSCSVEDCDGEFYARGWCQAHYVRWWRYGDPLAGRREVATHRTRVTPWRFV